MTLQALAQIGGVIGVIASLIYVDIQIRNSARAVRASAYQQLAANTSANWTVLAQNGDLTDILLRDLDDFHTLSRLEKARFRFRSMAYLRQYENAWFQHSIGTLKEDDWLAIAADMDSLFSNPGARTVWPLIQNRSNANFRAHVDGIVGAALLWPPSHPKPSMRQFQTRACHPKGVTLTRFSGYAPGPSRQLLKRKCGDA